MGKKSKKANGEEDLPQWHAQLPNATLDNVLELPQVDHGWICTLIRADNEHKFGILAILDITNRVRGEGMDSRFMNIGPCPNPKTKGADIAKALFATMLQPQPVRNNDDPAYFSPRRPAWVLLEKDLRLSLSTVQETLAAANIAVKLNTPEALAEDNDEAEDNRGRTATWEVGLAVGATADNVVKLPQKENEVWKCSMTMLEDEDSGATECFLALEDITEGADEENSYPLGVGPCPAPTVNPDGMIRAIFATMISPRAKTGGHSGDGRRPNRLVLDKPLEPWLEHVQSKLDAVGVTVEL
jgi:hypothetical protein